MQYKKNTQNTQINTITYSASETKPNPENCKNYWSKCAYDCAQLGLGKTTFIILISSTQFKQISKST